MAVHQVGETRPQVAVTANVGEDVEQSDTATLWLLVIVELVWVLGLAFGVWFIAT